MIGSARSSSVSRSQASSEVVGNLARGRCLKGAEKISRFKGDNPLKSLVSEEQIQADESKDFRAWIQENSREGKRRKETA
jgi:hypothetical protein